MGMEGAKNENPDALEMMSSAQSGQSQERELAFGKLSEKQRELIKDCSLTFKEPGIMFGTIKGHEVYVERESANNGFTNNCTVDGKVVGVVDLHDLVKLWDTYADIAKLQTIDARQTKEAGEDGFAISKAFHDML